jgi:hypothetical protein
MEESQARASPQTSPRMAWSDWSEETHTLKKQLVLYDSFGGRKSRQGEAVVHDELCFRAITSEGMQLLASQCSRE